MNHQMSPAMKGSVCLTSRNGIFASLSRQFFIVTGYAALMLMTGAHSARAGTPTVWTGPSTTFTKTNSANPALAVNQDRITSNVWLTRGSSQGLYNAKTESG